MNKRERVRLGKVLRDAALALRESAADHSYRRDAMKAIRERDLARFHDDRWTGLLAQAQALSDLADLLADDDLWPDLQRYRQEVLS